MEPSKAEQLRRQAADYLTHTQASLKEIKALNRKIGKAHKKVRAEERKLRKRLSELGPQVNPENTAAVASEQSDV